MGLKQKRSGSGGGKAKKAEKPAKAKKAAKAEKPAKAKKAAKAAKPAKAAKKAAKAAKAAAKPAKAAKKADKKAAKAAARSKNGAKARAQNGTRASWVDADSHTALEEQLEKLEHFATAMEDGVIDEDELSKQEQLLVDAMRAVEDELSDEVHEKVTYVLAELTAYNIMNVLHGLAQERLRSTIR